MFRFILAVGLIIALLCAAERLPKWLDGGMGERARELETVTDEMMRLNRRYKQLIDEQGDICE